MLVAQGTVAVAAPGAVTVKVKLTSAGRKLLRKAHGKAKLVGAGTFTPTGGKAVHTTRAFALKR